MKIQVCDWKGRPLEGHGNVLECTLEEALKIVGELYGFGLNATLKHPLPGFGLDALLWLSSPGFDR